MHIECFNAHYLLYDTGRPTSREAKFRFANCLSGSLGHAHLFRRFGNSRPFVHALLSKQGTLLISQYSVSEFSKASRENCLAAEQFVDRILPNVFLTDVNVDKLVAQEISAPNNEIRFWPPADLPQLKALATRAVVTQSPLSTASYFTTAFDHRTELLSLAATLYSELCEAITDMCTK